MPVATRTCAILALWAAASLLHADPYADYLRTAPEFQRVKQDPAVMIGRWNTWVYMPWRYQWSIGTEDAGGQFCRDTGINGGFVDRGEGPLAWLDRWQLRFYSDHVADKGYLYLTGANDSRKFAAYQRDARAVRQSQNGPQPLDDALRTRLEAIITRNVGKLKGSPMRVAYALDDEISWGVFVVPLPWRVNDDDAAYTRWLQGYYGGQAPPPQYVTPDFILPRLGNSLAELDFSPLLDRLTYNDSVWANFLGGLVECANRADPDTPCGFVGGQSPNLWGGYDYAKLMKKVQFIEAYNLGSSQAIIRSLNPGNALPQVTTHFHADDRGVANDIWQSWYYFAHGNRGMIGWVEGWFDGATPRPWLGEYSGALRELGGVQGPKLVGAQWVHDGVAIHYSHPSVQVSWCLDIEPHGKTWVNRTGSDHRLGTSHLVRQAWEDMLTDAGLQYSFVSYDQVATTGVPDEYRVLILPACYALSDIEAQRIREFVQRGGTVIADFACGLFDQHGKGRPRGALDDLFGVTHDGTETKADWFAGKLWVETDQDAGYNAATWDKLFGTLDCPLRDGFAIAEKRLPPGLVREVGEGRAVYLNLSPQRYLQHRGAGTASEAQRAAFLQPVLAATRPWLTATSNGQRPRDLEATYWRRDGRTLVCFVQKATTGGGPTGGNWAKRLINEEIPLTVQFAGPVQDAINERTGERLGDGQRFELKFRTLEAAMLSFRGDPPRPERPR